MPALAKADQGGLADEISHSGLRALLAHLSAGGGPEDGLYDAAEPLKAALELALGGLPQEEASLEEMFQAIAKKLRLRRIDEQLSHIARSAQKLADADGLGEEIRRLQQERIELLSLRKRVLEGTLEPAGTKVPWQPV
jgi:hypothetical protein